MLAATDPLVTAPVVETSPVQSSEAQLRGVVQQVIWTLQTTRKFVERRRGQRHAYPYPLRIWPASSCRMTRHAVQTVGEGDVVMGKHLSTGGLDFYTREPIADRKVVIRLECGEAEPVQVLVELTWCRFGGHGMYVNGGRFVRILNPNDDSIPGFE